jgi:hypothetical protein
MHARKTYGSDTKAAWPTVGGYVVFLIPILTANAMQEYLQPS